MKGDGRYIGVVSRPKQFLIVCAFLALAFACGAALGKALTPPAPTTVPAIDLSPGRTEGGPAESSERKRPRERREPREQVRPPQVTPARPPEEEGEGAQQVEPAPVVPDDNDDASTDVGSDGGGD